MIRLVPSKVESAFEWIVVWTTFAILHLVNTGHTRQEVQEGRLLGPDSEKFIKVPVDAEPQLARAEAHQAVEREVERQNQIDDKSKVFLTVCAFLIAANIGMLTQLSVWRIPTILSLLLTLVSVGLLLLYFRTYACGVVDLANVPWADAPNTHLNLANQEFKVVADASAQNGFRIAVQRAAWRLLLLSVVAMLAALPGAFFDVGPADPEARSQEIPSHRGDRLNEPEASTVVPAATQGCARSADRSLTQVVDAVVKLRADRLSLDAAPPAHHVGLAPAPLSVDALGLSGNGDFSYSGRIL